MWSARKEISIMRMETAPLHCADIRNGSLKTLRIESGSTKQRRIFVQNWKKLTEKAGKEEFKNCDYARLRPRITWLDQPDDVRRHVTTLSENNHVFCSLKTFDTSSILRKHACLDFFTGCLLKAEVRLNRTCCVSRSVPCAAGACWVTLTSKRRATSYEV